MRRLLPPALFLICLLLALGLHALLPVARWLPAPWNLAGLGLVPVGLWLLMRASGLFARRGTNINTFLQPDVLVTDGPFRYSRNPMYLGFALVLLGGALALGTLTPLVGPALFLVAADRWYIPFEERACEVRFGDAYRAYQARTRRWL